MGWINICILKRMQFTSVQCTAASKCHESVHFRHFSPLFRFPVHNPPSTSVCSNSFVYTRTSITVKPFFLWNWQRCHKDGSEIVSVVQIVAFFFLAVFHRSSGFNNMKIVVNRWKKQHSRRYSLLPPDSRIQCKRTIHVVILCVIHGNLKRFCKSRHFFSLHISKHSTLTNKINTNEIALRLAPGITHCLFVFMIIAVIQFQHSAFGCKWDLFPLLHSIRSNVYSISSLTISICDLLIREWRFIQSSAILPKYFVCIYFAQAHLSRDSSVYL